MRKKYKLSTLINLYMNYIFQKISIIVILSSFVLMFILLISIANPNLSDTTYLNNYKDIHKNYFENSFVVIEIFNSIMISTIIIMIIHLSNSFDILFLSYVKRKDLCIAKLIVLSLIFLIIILLESFILYLIPNIIFRLYKMNIKDLLIILYLIITIVFEVTLESLLLVLVPSIFIPMVVLFFAIIIRIIALIIPMYRDVLEFLVPMILVKDQLPYMGAAIIGIIWAIIFTFLYITIYNYRDIKN